MASVLVDSESHTHPRAWLLALSFLHLELPTLPGGVFPAGQSQPVTLPSNICPATVDQLWLRSAQRISPPPGGRQSHFFSES